MGYKICPYCGAALDPGEKCDCREEAEAIGAAAAQQEGAASMSRTGSENRTYQQDNKKREEKRNE